MSTRIALLLALAALIAPPACKNREHAAASLEAARCCEDGNGIVYEYVEVQERPSFPGGEPAMYAWLGNNLHYPEAAQEAGLQGTSWVQFNVACDGSIHDVMLARGAAIALDTTAVNVVRRMPDWTPGRNKGKPVCVRYVLPVEYRLK